MEFSGKVVAVTRVTEETLRVECDISERRNGILITVRAASIEVPARFAVAYWVGREVTGIFSPVEK